MSSLSPETSRQPQELQVGQLRFVGEQDGRPERELKRHLVESFSRGTDVYKAYLAKVRYGTQLANGVAICLRMKRDANPVIASEIGRIFASLFSNQVHMDIVFLDDAKEAEVARVCKPFYDVVS